MFFRWKKPEKYNEIECVTIASFFKKANRFFSHFDWMNNKDGKYIEVYKEITTNKFCISSDGKLKEVKNNADKSNCLAMPWLELAKRANALANPIGFRVMGLLECTAVQGLLLILGDEENKKMTLPLNNWGHEFVDYTVKDGYVVMYDRKLKEIKQRYNIQNINIKEGLKYCNAEDSTFSPTFAPFNTFSYCKERTDLDLSRKDNNVSLDKYTIVADGKYFYFYPLEWNVSDFRMVVL